MDSEVSWNYKALFRIHFKTMKNTMITRTTIINDLIISYNLNSYLEIGVRDANDNYNKIKIASKEGVDPDPITSCDYQMTSDEFFQNFNQKTYDVIFVDGLHTNEQAYSDVKNSIKSLNNEGFIVMHDCNPIKEYHTRSYEKYVQTGGHWNGDVYKAFIRLKSELDDWNIFVVNEDWGCGILTKRELTTRFQSLTNNDNLKWTYFDKNRKKLLDLISYNDFQKLIEIEI